MRDGLPAEHRLRPIQKGVARCGERQARERQHLLLAERERFVPVALDVHLDLLEDAAGAERAEDLADALVGHVLLALDPEQGLTQRAVRELPCFVATAS